MGRHPMDWLDLSHMARPLWIVWMVALFLAAFSIGIGVGSVLCGRLMRGEISARYVPLAALGMALFSFDLAFASLQAARALAVASRAQHAKPEPQQERRAGAALTLPP